MVVRANSHTHLVARLNDKSCEAEKEEKKKKKKKTLNQRLEHENEGCNQTHAYIYLLQ